MPTYDAKTYATPAIAHYDGIIYREATCGRVEDGMSALAQNDIIRLFKLPVGAKIIRAGITVVEVLGAAVAADIEIYDGSTAYDIFTCATADNALNALGIVGNKAGIALPGLQQVTDDADWIVRMNITDGNPTDDKEFRVWIEYTLDVEDSARYNSSTNKSF